MMAQQANNSFIYHRIIMQYTSHKPHEQIERSEKSEKVIMMLNSSYLISTNAKNQLLFYIQSISAISVRSYRAAFNKRT